MDSQENPAEIKIRKVELDFQNSPGEIKSRELQLDSQENPGVQEQGSGAGLSREPRRVQEQGSGAGFSRKPQERSRGSRWSWTLKTAQESSRTGRRSWALIVGWFNCLAAELFLNSCISDTVFVTLLRTALETAISEVHTLLSTGRVRLHLLNIVVLAVAEVPSVFTGRSGRRSYSPLHLPPLSSSFPPPPPALSPSTIIGIVSVDVRHHVSDMNAPPQRVCNLTPPQRTRQRVHAYEVQTVSTQITSP